MAPSNGPLLTHPLLRPLYTLLALLYETTLHLPLLALLYTLSPRSRPDPTWTLPRSLRIAAVRAIVLHTSRTQSPVPLSLAPGREGPRFEVFDPQPAGFYRGVLDDSEVRPGVCGGTWYPRPPPPPGERPSSSSSSSSDGAVVLHLHGGAFVLGDGRDADCGALARGMLARKTVSRVFCPQYRLSSRPTNARFPAAVQDAVGAYAHLLHHHGVPARRVILSGDSAGGNIALAVLRYIGLYGEAIGLEKPGAAWLWSPWVRPVTAVEKGGEGYVRGENYGVDYLSVGFGRWGAGAYAREEKVVGSVWVSGGRWGELCGAPMWVQVGGKEMLLKEGVEFFGELRGQGAECELEITEHAPHDIPLVAHLVGFEREYGEALGKAEAFYRRVTAAEVRD